MGNYLFISTTKLPTKELRRRIKSLTPKGKYVSKAVWGSILEYESELAKRNRRRKGWLE